MYFCRISEKTKKKKKKNERMMTGFVIHSQNIKLLEKICRPLLLSIKQKR